MTMQAVHHGGLVVRDLDRSIYFYHDILGLGFVNEPTPWFEGEDLAKGVGVPGASLRQVTLAVGEHSTIELIEYGNRPASNSAPIPNNHLGAAHMCFRVEDIVAKRAELESKGVEFYSEINVIDEGPLEQWRWCYFDDPDGLVLEIVQIDGYRKDVREQNAEEYLRTRPSLAEVEARLQ